ncbi:MAG TPA: hypothetical protein VJO13_02405 [Ktedonobacterales bacterium]|nr:hypothetical protein [Ktedonobacterales bacterium]
MTTAAARPISKSQIIIPITLGIIPVPLAQIALWSLGGSEGVTLIWLAGTPLAYFLIGGVTAFTTVSGLIPAQARARGAWVGFIAGISGACSAVVVAVAFAVWYISAPTQPTSLAHPQSSAMARISYAAMMGPVFPPIIVFLFVLLPLFLGANLFGIGLAPLGGMLGGYLRARVSPHQAALLEQTGDQALAHSGRWILVVIIGAVLLAVIVVAILLAINIIALAPHTAGAFPATTG